MSDVQRRSLPGLFPDELEQLVESWGEPAYRARQIFQWIHRRGVLDPHQMTDLPVALRERMQLAQSEEVRRLKSLDGLTSKLLLRLHDGQEIEAVEMNTAMRLRAVRENVSPGWAPRKTYATTEPRLHKSSNPASLPLFS